MGWDGGWDYRPYVPVAQRRANALREVRRLAGKGKQVSPVEIAGRAIASTFWGKAWCENLESYSDFSNRLPRGRTYARNGSVVDLQIEPGKVTSLVSGSHLYRITVQIRPLAAARWKRLKQRCGAGIGSVVELLQGRLSTSVMAVVTSRESGLFPTPAEIEMSCSCPDWADMCKHVAATLYGIGNRLDHSPELLFKLRQVDYLELIAQVGRPAAKLKGAGRKMIAKDQLADVFGIEFEAGRATSGASSVQRAKTRRNGAFAALEGEKNGQASTRETRYKSSSACAESATASKSSTLSAKARKRIAEAQRKRWQTLRERMRSQNGNGTSPLPVFSGKPAHAPPAPPVRAKSAHRARS
jgi:uncharacterized Zn finger protein